MTLANKDKMRALLKSIETGDPGPVAVVDEERYIQHNPQTHEGSEGLAALFARLSKSSPWVNIVRAFEDGDFVFGHTEYDFASRKIGFEVFRFENGRAVEHWDNIQERLGPNRSERSMVDGPTDAADHDLTEENRALVRTFAETVLVGGQLEQLEDFIDGDGFAEHNPNLEDGVAVLRAALEETSNDGRRIDYHRVHRGAGRRKLRPVRQRGCSRRDSLRVLRSFPRRFRQDRRTLGHDGEDCTAQRVEERQRQVLARSPVPERSLRE